MRCWPPSPWLDGPGHWRSAPCHTSSCFALRAPRLRSRRPAAGRDDLVEVAKPGSHAALLEMDCESLDPVTHLLHARDEVKAGSADQPDPAVRHVPDALVPAERLVAARAVAVLSRELRLE